ncbi:MAG: DUF86 domain-containing protein [Desulfomonilaceae bacterium]
MKRDYEDYLNDIIEAVTALQQFVEGMSFEEFREDQKTLFAVTRAFEVLGEAAKKILQTLRTKHPDIPWREMAGMRDKLIHEYFAVDVNVFWKTIQEDLPLIRSGIARLLPSLYS